MEYQDLKKGSNKENVVCHHVGEFSQEILISLISLIDNSLLKNSLSTGFKKRLKYIVIEAIQNIKAKKSITGGKKVNESDGYCAALPYFLYNSKEADLKRIIKSVANSKINETYALAKLKIIDLAMKGEKTPVNAFVRKYEKKRYFKDVVANIKKVLRLKKKIILKL